MKYYIVQKLGWEYDDNNYFQGEDTGGTPQKVFTSYSKAEKLADKLNLEELNECRLGEYGYGEKVDEEFFDIYNKLFDDTLTEIDWDFELPKLTKEQYNELKDHILVKFYEVVECEGE